MLFYKWQDNRKMMAEAADAGSNPSGNTADAGSNPSGNAADAGSNPSGNAATGSEITKADNTAQIGETKSSGTNSPAFSANHIIQYPKQPVRDDGMWLALASLFGTIIGRIASTSLIKKAKNAENEWNKILERMRDVAYDLIDNQAPLERELAKAADDWLLEMADFMKDLGLDEEDYADKLEPCNDLIHEKLCQFITCGYQPDYLGISMRVTADAEAKAKNKRQELCRTVGRYGVNQCCDIETRIALATSAEIVGAVTKAREAERQKAWELNYKLYFEGAELFEKHRSTRKNTSKGYLDSSTQIQGNRYNAHNKNYQDLLRLGLEVLASVGKNYAWLAQSYRTTAEKDAAGLSNLLGLAVVLIGYWLSNKKECATDKEDPCSVDESKFKKVLTNSGSLF